MWVVGVVAVVSIVGAVGLLIAGHPKLAAAVGAAPVAVAVVGFAWLFIRNAGA